MSVTLSAHHRALAEAWRELDPDAETRADVDALLAGADNELEDRFGQRLSFGTAGLRGAIGAGPNRMSRVLIRVVAAALAQRVLRDEPGGHLVVGYDARHKSREFAEDTVRVAAAHGLHCTLLPEPLPTPVLAFTVRHLDASAGVMVTASHNPKADNGYKVYWRGGAQISSPLDGEISALIDTTPLVAEGDLAPVDHPHITIAGPELAETYTEAIVGMLEPQAPRTARVAYTPLHGVGAASVTRAFAAAGFPTPAVVESQAAPDPDFPTAPFPNPEETGVLDPLLDLATSIDADVALANDPDADRLAVAIPNGPSWRLLTGDELGSLLAEHLLSRPAPTGHDRLVINTVVSSRLLSKIAQHHGARYAETLTGFKWIMHERQARAAEAFVLGYEEALGYSVGETVADKDGVSAALVVAEMVSQLTAKGSSLADVLDDLHQRHGVHATGQRSIRFEATDDPVPVMTQAMAGLRERAPEHVAGLPVIEVIDLGHGHGGLAPADAVILNLENGRVVIRPSGTEPKMKVYGEVILPAGDDLAAAQLSARAALTGLLDGAVALAAAPERAAIDDAHDPTDDDLPRRAESIMATLPEGAARAGALRMAVRCVDLTTLEGDDTPARIRALCAQARRPDPADPTVGPVAAVCVHPALTGLARELLGHGAVEVASVAGAFPAALSIPEVRLADVSAAVDAGAGEIDMVLDRSAFLSGHPDVALAGIAAARTAVGRTNLKVIIEVGELGTVGAIRAATRLAIAGGADVVATATGKSKADETPTAVLAVAETIAEHHRDTGQAVGLKIGSGARTADDALGYLAIIEAALGPSWLTPERFRLGASDLLNAVLTDLVATEAALTR